MSDTNDKDQNDPVLTPTHNARLTELVDTALDVLESNMVSGKSEVKQKAADSVLDRAGLTKAQAQRSIEGGETIPAEAVAQVLRGLAHVFGTNSGSDAPRDVTEPVNKEPRAAKGVLASRTGSAHSDNSAGEGPSRRSKTAKASAPGPASAPGKDKKSLNEDKTEEHSEKLAHSGLPQSLLRQYGGTVRPEGEDT